MRTTSDASGNRPLSSLLFLVPLLANVPRASSDSQRYANGSHEVSPIEPKKFFFFFAKKSLPSEFLFVLGFDRFNRFQSSFFKK